MGLRDYLSKIGSHFIILKKYGSRLPIILFLIWMILITISQVILSISGFDILYLSLKDKIELSLTFAIACLAGVQTIGEIERRKIERLQNELEKAYGPMYSILMRPDEMWKTRTGEYAIILISPDEKNALDKIIKTYPFMFPYDIVVLWRVEIRDMMPYSFYSSSDSLRRPMEYAIPLKLREKIKKEYDRRVIEYYEATGRKRESKIMSHPLT